MSLMTCPPSLSKAPFLNKSNLGNHNVFHVVTMSKILFSIEKKGPSCENRRPKTGVSALPFDA